MRDHAGKKGRNLTRRLQCLRDRYRTNGFDDFWRSFLRAMLMFNLGSPFTCHMVAICPCYPRGEIMKGPGTAANTWPTSESLLTTTFWSFLFTQRQRYLNPQVLDVWLK